MKLACNYVLNCFSSVFSRSYKMNRFVSVVVGVAGMAFVASADLITVNFADNAFSGADEKTSFTSEEHGIKLTAYPEKPFAAKLTQSVDGIGIKYGLDLTSEEVNGKEVLTIDFGRDVNLESVYISNLDQLDNRDNGKYVLSNGYEKKFKSINRDGELTLNINQTVSSIKFSAPGLGLFNNFSVRGLSYTSIPEPATSVPEPAMLSFLGMSLLGLGFMRNRKK